MKFRILVRGILAFFFHKYITRKKERNAFSAKYAYSVWFRHYYHIFQYKQKFDTIAEIGPGSSLGVGICALFSNAKKYIALDTIKHTELNENIPLVEEISLLFKEKTPIPDKTDFPNIKPNADLSFPSRCIDISLLGFEKIEKIKHSLNQKLIDSSIIQYKYDWNTLGNVTKSSIDVILSQAVMEHILNIHDTYQSMYQWLKPGGLISHQIDYKSHETHKIWNGHWYYPKWLWKIILKGRNYPINRLPHSCHIEEIENAGFTILETQIFSNYSGKRKVHLDKNYLESDYLISEAYILAQKPYY